MKGPKHEKHIYLEISVGETAFYPGCLHKACFSSVEAILLFIYFYASGCCPVPRPLSCGRHTVFSCLAKCPCELFLDSSGVLS